MKKLLIMIAAFALTVGAFASGWVEYRDERNIGGQGVQVAGGVMEPDASINDNDGSDGNALTIWSGHWAWVTFGFYVDDCDWECGTETWGVFDSTSNSELDSGTGVTLSFSCYLPCTLAEATKIYTDATHFYFYGAANVKQVQHSVVRDYIGNTGSAHWQDGPFWDTETTDTYNE